MDQTLPEGAVGSAQKGLFNARDGTSIYYEVRGTGRPLVFCYGLVCRREHWHHQIEYFAQRYQVITFDYRAHQFSSRPKNDRNLTLEWCARDVEDLVRHLGIKEIVCLGHSMGVPVITHLSQMLPEVVKGLVFVCGIVTNPFEHMFYSGRMDYVFQAALKVYGNAPSVMNYLWYKFTEKNRLNYFLTSRLGFNASKAEKQDVLLYMEGVNQTPFSTFQALIGDYAQFDGRSLLKKVKVPALVIAGEDDYITPLSLQEEVADLLPLGELVTIPDGSHNAHMDFPERVNGSIDQFLQRIEYK